MNNKSECCTSKCNCCEPKLGEKKLVIDFLYLDLSVCQRCQGTESNLEQAIGEVQAVLKAAGFEIIVNKININTMELAQKYQFLSSPTIRINGIDIDMEVKETPCGDCGDLCGDSVDCRVWVYEGSEYNEPPKALIINAILQFIYNDNKPNHTEKKEYKLPNNLKLFFEGLERK